MLSFVYLYNKFLFETDKIKYILFEWVLSTEFVSIKLPSTYDAPQFFFLRPSYCSGVYVAVYG